MMRQRLLLVPALLVAAASATSSQSSSSATRTHVETLASERFAGREAGSAGERLAGDYLAAQLARLGAKPLPGRMNMFVPFEFTAGSKDGGSQLRIGGATFNAPQDVLAVSFSDEGDVTGVAVFAGYGNLFPESQNFG
jgi:hypothetical protein